MLEFVIKFNSAARAALLKSGNDVMILGPGVCAVDGIAVGGGGGGDGGGGGGALVGPPADVASKNELRVSKVDVLVGLVVAGGGGGGGGVSGGVIAFAGPPTDLDSKKELGAPEVVVVVGGGGGGGGSVGVAATDVACDAASVMGMFVL